MNPRDVDAVHLAHRDHHGEFIAMIELVLPRAVASVEALGLYLFLVACWGLILVVAMTSALP